MTDFKVVAFDCDGVLFDTQEANQAYYNHILRHFGKPEMTPAQFAYAHQHTLHESIAYLFNDPESIAAVFDYRETMDYGARSPRGARGRRRRPCARHEHW